MNEKISRRRLLGRAAALTGAAFVGRTSALGQTKEVEPKAEAGNQTRRAPYGKSGGKVQPVWMRDPHPEPGIPGKHYRPTISLDSTTLPFKVVNGVKIFHLICQEVDHEFIPKTETNDALRAYCWGFNGQVHGPTIEAVEGDRVRIYVTNKLPAATSIHWHGILLPNGMDGVGGLSQKSIQPGETFQYEFTLWQHGTNMYHSHHDEMTQMALGMLGMFIIHPREPQAPPPDRDFVYMLSEWRIDVGTRRPNPNEMTDFNVLTLNAKAFPGTSPMIAKLGDAVRIRIGNLSAMDHHPIHLHGHAFYVTETDGGRIAREAQWPETGVLVPVGTTRAIDFIANNPGDWAMHCHMTHHVMNQMGHDFPNMIGLKKGNLDKQVRTFQPGYMTMGETGMAEMGEMGMKIPKNSAPMIGAPGPHGYITMGGMFSILKVRENLESYDKDPGWFENPEGTLAAPATSEAMQRDLGMIPNANPSDEKPMQHGDGHHHGT
jgi:manganese oxidase